MLYLQAGNPYLCVYKRGKNFNTLPCYRKNRNMTLGEIMIQQFVLIIGNPRAKTQPKWYMRWRLCRCPIVGDIYMD